MRAQLLCAMISGFAAIAAMSLPAIASTPSTPGLHVTDCSQANGVDIVRWTGISTEPQILVVLSFLNNDGGTTSQEFFIADGPPADQSIVTRSLLSGNVLASFKSVSCAVSQVSDRTSVSLTSGSSCVTGDVQHVDSGPIVEVRQGAVYRSGIRLYLSASFRDFFAQGLSDMAGSGVFESDGPNKPRSEVELTGFGPQAVVLGFAGLPPGQHDIIYGTTDGPSETVLGHVCYSNWKFAAI